MKPIHYIFYIHLDWCYVWNPTVNEMIQSISSMVNLNNHPHL